MIDALGERGGDLLERLEARQRRRPPQAIAAASDRLTSSLNFKTDHIGDEFTEIAANLQHMMSVRLDRVTEGFSQKSVAIVDMMTDRTQETHRDWWSTPATSSPRRSRRASRRSTRRSRRPATRSCSISACAAATSCPSSSRPARASPSTDRAHRVQTRSRDREQVARDARRRTGESDTLKASADQVADAAAGRRGARNAGRAPAVVRGHVQPRRRRARPRRSRATPPRSAI